MCACIVPGRGYRWSRRCSMDAGMKATDFDYRHQTLLHLLVVGLGVSTYFLSRDDIVWALVRHHSNSRFLEQAAFGVGTLMLLGCDEFETWAIAYPQPVILLL